MTSIIAEDGTLTPVTLLSATPSTITQIKNNETDGYTAIQVGYETSKKLPKPVAGHFKKSKVSPKIVREFRVDELSEDLAVGTSLTSEIFSIGDVVSVTGTSKGKGFESTIKRHNFKRGRKTHGGRSYRRVGSIGSMYPQKIFKGKRMAGRGGGATVTTKNLKVVIIDNERQVIGVSGAVAGPRKSIVLVKGVE
jgi:large subunit ribosomal protein L3